MKKIFVILFAIAAASCGQSKQAKEAQDTEQTEQTEHTLNQLWASTEQLPTPESVLYMPDRDELFVALIDGDGSEKDGEGGVAILNLDGSLKNPTWVQGLNAPKGMAVHDGKLYVADITDVVVVDISNGEVVETIPVEGATFLNDVTADASGKVYVSDTRQNKIFLVENNRASLYLDEVPSVNGLKIIDGDLYALAGPELWHLDKDKNKTIIAEGFEQGGDGLEPIGNGDYLVTCWAGLIYYVNADGSFYKLLDVQGEMNTADLGYNPEEKILYIPTFNSNSVVAYELK